MNNFLKKQNINKLKIIAIIVALSTLFSILSPISNNQNFVNADDITCNIDSGTNLKMTEGASVRVASQDESGLRFQVNYKKSFVDDLKSKIGAEYKSVGFGSFIVPYDYRNHYAITHVGLAEKSVLDVEINDFLPNSSDGWYKANVSIIGIKLQNYDRSFMSRHYVKLVYQNGRVEYIYAPITTQPRSVYDVAKSAFSDRSSSNANEYCYDTNKSGEYKYSKYNGTQLSIIKSFIDAVVVLDKTTKAYAGGLPSGLYTPSYSVSGDKVTSTNKIAKMYWSDGTKIQGSINDTSAKYTIAGAQSGRSASPVYSLSFNVIGGNDVMPIMGNGIYTGNTAEMHNYFTSGQNWTYGWDYCSKLQAQYWMKEFKAVGINIVDDMTTYSDDASGGYKTAIKNHLTYAAQNNLGVIFIDSVLNGYAWGNSKTQEQLNAINTRLNELRGYESFIGLTIRDEPRKKADIDNMKKAKNSVLSGCSTLMSNKIFYGNLLPSMSNSSTYEIGKSGDDFANYGEYVDYYISQFQPKFLSFDLYPFRVYTNGWADNINLRGWFDNLSQIRAKANAYHIPFWSYIQCGADWDGDNSTKEGRKVRPNESEFRWLVNTALAYGTKGIEYFEAQQRELFSQGKNGPNYSRNGIWGYNGQRNEWYNYALEANNQIKAIDEYLMNATQEGLIVGSGSSSSSLIPSGDKKNSYYELTSVTGNVMVGCFNYKGRTALYVVNDSTSLNNGSCTLNFSGNYTYTQVRNATKTTSLISGNKISLSNLKAGEGVLIVLD